MTLEPRLIDVAVPARPQGAVLVLHGGAARRENMRVSPAQLSVLRMVPIARRIAAAGRGRLAVFRLLNARRGWDAHHTPVRDVEWALGEVSQRLHGTPATCLVGHSLGGRAALLSAGRPEVTSVAALAPWVYAEDSPEGELAGTRIMVVHGDRDRVADPDRAETVARRLATRAEVSWVTVRGGTHAMLSRRDAFDGLAASFAVASLLGGPAEGAVARVLAGEPRLEL